MKKLSCGNSKHSSVLFMAMIWLLAFQSPLEKIWTPFSYIDELVALIGVFLGLYEIVLVQKCRATKEQLWVGIPLAIYVLVGLTGNFLYRYQPLKAVVIDLYTNLKFFFAIGSGYYLFRNTQWNDLKNSAVLSARIIVLLLFSLFLLDRFVNIWPAEVRYGVKSAVLFYSHPTYLAGAMAFLTVLLTVFYEKKNLPYIGMALVMMVFTLRSKSIASAAAYIAMFAFFVLLKRKLKLWYVAVMGAACVMIAWPQISFYFIELGGASARSVILLTSFIIMKDYFPIGTGFGTYGSAEAAKCYSPVYLTYGFNDNFELRDVANVENSIRLINASESMIKRYAEDPEFVNSPAFLSDHFWPIIFGQTGVAGTLAFLAALGVVVKRCFRIDKFDLHAYVGVLYAFVYLLISSVAETAFHNAIAIPLALVMGIVLCKEKERHFLRDKETL